MEKQKTSRYGGKFAPTHNEETKHMGRLATIPHEEEKKEGVSSCVVS